jgi:hypothetical protein
LAGHTFTVRPGGRNLTPEQWLTVRRELITWYPGCRLESEIEPGEMGPFGVRVAKRISISIVDGPDSRSAATSLLKRALEGVGRADLLELETAW